MPELQMSELAYDDANSQLIAQREDLGQSSGQFGNGHEDETPFPIKMSASLQANSRSITLNYQVSEDVTVSFFACDLAGRLLGNVTHVSLSAGEYHETMALIDRPINSIVMLTMVVGDRKQVIKVL